MANSIIEVSGLCKSYSSFQLQDISFSLAEGCIMGLIGENGAGKTTTLKALLDIVRPDSGEIRLFGQPVRSDSALLKEQIGVVWENSFFYEGLTAQDVQRCMAGVYKQWDSVLYRRLLDQFQLPFRQPMQKLSRGMRMKLLIANALAHHPRLLILDEATSSVDTRTEVLIQKAMNRLMEGRTSFIIAHRLSTIKSCSRIMYIDDGRIMESGTHEELMAKKGNYYKLYMSQYRENQENA